jgi:hypothetical protein
VVKPKHLQITLFNPQPAYQALRDLSGFTLLLAMDHGNNVGIGLRNLDCCDATPAAAIAFETTFAIWTVQSAGNSPHVIVQFGCEGPLGLDVLLPLNREQHCFGDLYGSSRVGNITFFGPVALAKRQSDEHQGAAEHYVSSHVVSPSGFLADPTTENFQASLPRLLESTNWLPSGSLKMAMVPQTSVFGSTRNSTPLDFSTLAVAKTSSHQNDID